MATRVLFYTLILFLSVGVVITTSQTLSPKEELGKAIFFDQNLSINANQPCAACHDPEVGWTGPNATINSHGALARKKV
jgi:cytochrome c peroxidase